MSKRPRVKKAKGPFRIRLFFLRILWWFCRRFVPKSCTYTQEYNLAVQMLHYHGMHHWKYQLFHRAQQLHKLQKRKKGRPKRRKK